MDKENEDKEKDPAAVALGARGGRAAAESLTPAEREERARIAAKARWDGHTYSTQPHAVWARKRHAKLNGKRRKKETL